MPFLKTMGREVPNGRGRRVTILPCCLHAHATILSAPGLTAPDDDAGHAAGNAELRESYRTTST
ncbi:MAG: hypothetical protein MZV63_42275 [Marinilabiliales bacterium]|nr:hypothetical protein [Marinilabiliales bacterium]